MAYYGVDLQIRVEELNLQFKNQIRQRGGNGIRTLGRLFRRMDNNGNKKLDAQEFEQALNEYGLFCKKTDIQGMMKHYDVDGDGNISFEEFLRGLRDELTSRKKAMVEKAFVLMDKDNSGKINMQDIVQLYDVTQNKEFQEGKKTRDEILMEFLNNFDGVKGNNDGIISKQEWTDYYTDLAMSTPSDEYFVRMMEQTWCLAENEQAGVFQDQIRHLTSMMRQRLITLSNSSQEEYMLRKIFQQFDLNQSGSITNDELAGLLAKLGISVERKYLVAMIEVLDSNKSGAIEFEEFANFLINDPYK